MYSNTWTRKISYPTDGGEKHKTHKIQSSTIKSAINKKKKAR